MLAWLHALYVACKKAAAIRPHVSPIRGQIRREKMVHDGGGSLETGTANVAALKPVHLRTAGRCATARLAFVPREKVSPL